MRIALIECYLKPTPDYGILAKLLRERGHDVWLGTTNAANDLVWHNGEQVVATQTREMSLPRSLSKLRKLPLFKRLEDLWFIGRMRRFLRQQKIDVAQLNPATLNWVGLISLGMPTAFVLDWRQIAQRDAQGRLGKLKNWWAHNRRLIYSTKLYDSVTFLHAAGAEKVLGPSWQKWAQIVPLGVDRSFLERQAPRVQVNNADNKPQKVTFLYIGTLSRVRRLERLLHAAQIMLATTQAFQLVFLGPDTAQGYYQQLIDELGVDEVVSIRPPVPYSEIADEILAHDVALAYVPEYPLDWQYHPTLKVIEYCALGVPIIATNFAPNREIVKDEENGLLVENTGQSLANAMLRFVTDRSFLAHCRENARRSRRGIPWTEIAELYERTVYLPAISKKRVRSTPSLHPVSEL